MTGFDLGDVLKGAFNRDEKPQLHDWDWSGRAPACKRCLLVWEAGASPQQVQEFLSVTCKGLLGMVR